MEWNLYCVWLCLRNDRPELNNLNSELIYDTENKEVEDGYVD